MKREALILMLLIALGGVVQGFMVFRAVTPAQDAVRFVSIAQRMEREGTLATLRDESEHPLYPLAIRTAYPVVCGPRGAQLDNWAIAAQWSAAFPLILCTIPIYLLLRTVASVRGAAVGTLLFSLGRQFAALGASALSDGWTLLFTCVFLACVARLILGAKFTGDSRHWGKTASLAGLSGLALGIAAMAHQLALVSGAAALAMAVVLIIGVAPTKRLAAGRLLCCGVCFSTGFVVVLCAWFSAAAVDSPATALARLFGRETAETQELAHVFDADAGSAAELSLAAGVSKIDVSTQAETEPSRGHSKWSLQSGEKMSFDKKDPNLSLRRHGFAAAGTKYVRELVQALGFVLGGLALAGLVKQLRRSHSNGPSSKHAARRPLPAFFTGFFLLYSGVLIVGASRFGYIEARHLLPAVIAVIPLAVDAVEALLFGTLVQESSRRRCMLALSCVAGLAVCAISLASPLHASRAAHRQAASWMAVSGRPPGAVLDTRGWTQFYSGRFTHLLSAGRIALRDPQLRYIVMERQELEFESTRAATLLEIVGQSSDPVATFTADDGPHKDVLIYEWHAERFATRKMRLAQR